MQREKHREVTGKMLDVVSKKLNLINSAELSQGAVTEWVQTAIKAEQEIAGLVTGSGKPEMRQGEIGQFTGAMTERQRRRGKPCRRFFDEMSGNRGSVERGAA